MKKESLRAAVEQRSRHTIPWSDADIDKLRAMSAQNWEIGEIAKRLGRTRQAIKGKALREGIDIPRFPKNPTKAPRRVYR